jgi:hypothetical protein
MVTLLWLNKENVDIDGIVASRSAKVNAGCVRCPGHAIHFMVFGYDEYIGRVLELAGLTAAGRSDRWAVAKTPLIDHERESDVHNCLYGIGRV